MDTARYIFEMIRLLGFGRLIRGFQSRDEQANARSNVKIAVEMPFDLTVYIRLLMLSVHCVLWGHKMI